MSRRPALVLIGGFLGAGKTTLILAAARVLQSRGLCVAAILNDQGEDLIDTQLARQNGVPADQVTGGCFCCRFSDLLEAAERLEAHDPDVIFAEAVGSCTDIVATTLQPLLREYAARFRLAPFTVLVDPGMAEQVLADENLSFLWRNQLAEADLVWCSKLDMEFGWSGDLPHLSARTGEGVEVWLDQVLGGELPVGGRLLEIDYERYARAEAALVWLNCRVIVRPDPPCAPAMVVGPLLDGLDARLTAARIRIVHAKVMDQCLTGYVKAGLCSNGQEPSVEGVLDASPASEHEVLVNIRAIGEPEVLRSIVEHGFFDLGAVIEWRWIQCFRPAAPKPQFRVTA